MICRNNYWDDKSIESNYRIDLKKTRLWCNGNILSISFNNCKNIININISKNMQLV